MTYVFTWDLRVRTYECDSLGHVNNAIYLNWVEEAKLVASEEAGWTVELCRERGMVIVMAADLIRVPGPRST